MKELFYPVYLRNCSTKELKNVKIKIVNPFFIKTNEETAP